MRRIRRAFRAFLERRRKKRLRSLVTLAGSGLMLGWFAPPAFALGAIGVIAAHEIGHYLAARRVGADAEWPMFWAVWLFAGGLTTVRYELPDGPTIALAGPAAGVTAALCLIAMGGFAPMLAVAGVYALVFEVLGVIFGADGRAFRADRRELRSA